MPPKKSKNRVEDKYIDKNKYNALIPQAIESFGNFLNNSKNPGLILFFLFLIGCGYGGPKLLLKATYIISSSIDKLSININKINDNMIKNDTKNEIESNRQTQLLEDIKQQLENRKKS